MADPRDTLDRRLSVAPMMDRTDRHCRYFLRLLAPRTLLYTEMMPAPAILRGDRERLLGFDPAERPVALQIGGSEPRRARPLRGARRGPGYDEINLNLGCPSARVSQGGFGARLMAEPALVAECVSAMRGATRLPVTVKIRIGIDERDDYDHFAGFVDRLASDRGGGVRRARPQGAAVRPQPEGEPRDPAAALRIRASAEARTPRPDRGHQRRLRHRRCRARTDRRGGRGDARPRGLRQPVSAGPDRGRAARRRAAGPRPGHRGLCRVRGFAARDRRAALAHDAPRARAVPGPARRARLAADGERGGAPAGRQRGAAAPGACGWWTRTRASPPDRGKRRPTWPSPSITTRDAANRGRPSSCCRSAASRPRSSNT